MWTGICVAHIRMALSHVLAAQGEMYYFGFFVVLFFFNLFFFCLSWYAGYLSVQLICGRWNLIFLFWSCWTFFAMIARCFPYLLFVCAEAKTAKPHSLHIRPQQRPLILVSLLQLKVLTERTITNTWQPSSGGCPLEAIKLVFILHSWIWGCTVYTGYFLNMQKTNNPPETNHCRLHK